MSLTSNTTDAKGNARLNIQGDVPVGSGVTLHNDQRRGVHHDVKDPTSNVPNDTTAETTSQVGYSMARVSILLSLITILCHVAYTDDSVIAQYLLDRWSDESVHSKSQSHSGPDRGLCNKNKSDPWVIENDRIQARVSISTMYYSFASCFPAIFMCIFYGALVDIVGRRPALISSLLGYTCKMAIVLCIIRFKLDPNFFYLAYGINGLGGSFYLINIACFSITADISKYKSSRILGIAILMVIGKIMYAAANIMIGLLIKHVGYIAATSVIVAHVGMSFVIAFICMPETLPVPKQKISLKRIWNYMTGIVLLYSQDGEKRKRLSLLFSLLIFFASVVNTVNLGSNDTLYQRHEPLCWDSAYIGYYVALSNVVSIVALIYLGICRCIGCFSDEVLSMIGMLFVAGSLTLEAFVRNTWQMFLVPILMIPGLNVIPITRGVMSILAGPEKQGVMFSSVAVIEVMCSLASTVAYNKIYAATVGFMPGFLYLVMAGVAFITFLLYFPFFHFYDGPQKDHDYEALPQPQDNNDSSSIQSSTSSLVRENA